MKKDFYLDNKPETSSEEENKQTAIIKIKRKLDPHIAIIAMQSGICLAVILVCLIIKLFFSDFFTDIKKWYDENIDVDTNVKQVTEAENTLGSGGPLEVVGKEIKTKVGGDFVMPVSGTLTSSYGYRTDPFTGEIALHNGLDIAADEGAPIMAAVSGTVELAKNTTGDYGNYIILNHGGFKTLYGHCKSLEVKKGDIVSAGDVIATCGNTGRSTGSHLHFEVRIGDKRIDPTPFLNKENQ